MGTSLGSVAPRKRDRSRLGPVALKPDDCFAGTRSRRVRATTVGVEHRGHARSDEPDARRDLISDSLAQPSSA